MNPILITIVTLTAIGLLVSAILFIVAKKFKVEEDARIDDVEALLPGANCGGCGCAGCRDFATKLVSLDELGDVQCPVGGGETMNKIAALLGKTAPVSAPKIAVVKCNGTCENRPKVNDYDGFATCKVKASLYSGDTGCGFGCLGCGDCTRVCKFDAISMDPATGLPVVDESKCTGCGACVKACPKGVIELRPKGLRGMRVVVLCNNRDKGAVARKACQAACIGCAKCAKVCKFEAIAVENNLAYIDPEKCKLCTKCVDECPTGAIHKFNFPVKKKVEPKPEAAPEVKPVEKPVEKPAPEVKPEPKPEPEVKPEPKPVEKPAPEVKPEPVEKPAPAPEPAAEPAPAPEPDDREDVIELDI
ncbi:MAG: 4Fe-4S dicluster domain-containing protein [Bacteroidales bacterium]|nr:4Fe-4S dicluster domain-containing protein [Bacteroidales bacterium]